MKSAAMFIDFENLYFSLKGKYRNHDVLFMRIVENAIRRISEDFGSKVIFRRSYHPIENYGYSSLIEELALSGFRPFPVASKKKKNSADLMLSVDATELIFTHENIDCFCIIGGDSDYIPVASKIIEYGKMCVACVMPGSMSGDLMKFIGSENYIDPTKYIECVPIEKRRRKKKDNGSNIDIFDMLAVVAKDIRATHNNDELWMGPFITDVADRYPELSRADIRETIEEMEKIGVWRKEEKPSDRDGISSYHVLNVNWDHDIMIC